MSHCFIRKKFQLPPFSFSWSFNIWYICTFFCLQTQNQKSNKSICKQFAIPVLLVHRRAINVTSTMSFSIAVWKLLKPGDQLRFTLDGPIHPKFSQVNTMQITLINTIKFHYEVKKKDTPLDDRKQVGIKLQKTHVTTLRFMKERSY